MEIEFDKEYLAALYFSGKTPDKKHRYQPSIIKRYIRVIDLMRAVESTEDLYKFNSLNYEMLTGDKRGIESVRVNDQYRIEFKSTQVKSDIIVTVCNIIDLTNHYK
ncbi:MAG: type II toxin-antitoxin system RelE/ParE family toxin [Muribaculaceae bacterium]|nr:type II toxin-antitoxin system RelE/ParE family toxin [Muribaculaceae bacterium]